MSTTPSPNRDNGGRDAAGRFARGNPGGPGNPFARRVGRLRSVLLDAVSDDDLGDVAAGLLRAAKGGDVAAARLLLAYTVGRPAEAVNPDVLDVDEIQRIIELAGAFGDFDIHRALCPSTLRMALESLEGDTEGDGDGTCADDEIVEDTPHAPKTIGDGRGG